MTTSATLHAWLKRPLEESQPSAPSSSAPSSSAPAAPPKQPRASQPLPPAVADLVSTLQEESWRTALEKEFSKGYFAALAAKVVAERANKTVYPPRKNVFAAFNAVPLPSVRVVIIGQDPYINVGQAHGHSFSVQHGVEAPPSLKNIFKELAADVPGFVPPPHGCLEAWAAQGVMLLNASLTVRRGESNSHEKFGWQKFTDEVIRAINKRCDGVVFILWGGFAKKKGAAVSRQRHCVLDSGHPSPLAVNRRGPDCFIGSKCFSKANAYLEKKGKPPVDWSLPKAKAVARSCE